MSFTSALPIVLQFEGGYVNNPDDRGGATNQGVTQATLDQFCADSGRPPYDVQRITDGDVAAVYLNRYWRLARCNDLPAKLALVVFDGAVNHGVRRSVTLLQQTVHAIPDGIFGPQTLHAVSEQVKLCGEPVVCKDYLAQRAELYRRIVAHDATQQQFLAGWMRRLERLRESIA